MNSTTAKKNLSDVTVQKQQRDADAHCVLRYEDLENN